MTDKNRERAREYSRSWYVKRMEDPEFRAKRCAYTANWRKNNLERARAQTRKRDKRKRACLRLEVLTHYSGDPPHCQCSCGCRALWLPWLTIDHINNDGAEHRRKIGKRLYGWLRQNNYPSGFQVLCWNCNSAKERGGCPPLAI